MDVDFILFNILNHFIKFIDFFVIYNFDGLKITFITYDINFYLFFLAAFGDILIHEKLLVQI